MSAPLLQVEDKQIDAEALLTRVRETVKNAGAVPLPVAAPVGSARALSGRLQELDRALARASESWAVGTRVPPMHKMKGLFRTLATPAAKAVLRMAQLITRDQRDFNEAVLQAIRHAREAVAAQGAVIAQSATLDHLENERHQRESELARLWAENKAERSLLHEQLGVLDALRAELSQLDGRLKDEVTRREQVRHSLVLQERRLTVLIEEARRRLPAPLDASQLQIFAAEGQKLRDALYPAFEDAFRGSTDEIRLRLGAYLPLLREVKAGDAGRPIVDIGCGRGELLDLLREHGLEAIGVDSNDEMLERARARGLEVAKGDAISHLRALPDASLGAVTVIHVIEHLPLEAVLALFEECARVLKPGGIALFETPNPENVLVGACNFYMDPTHIRPLHPSTMRYLAEARGLTRVRIEYFRPMSVPALEGTPGTKWIKENMLGAQDYAVIGYRASE